MRRVTKVCLLVAILCSFSRLQSYAQFNFDEFSVRASINDHKDVSSKLLVRSSIEQANELLHQATSKRSENYKEISVELDKYDMCFDIIDLILKGATTVANVYTSIEEVSDRIGKCKALVERYNDLCLSKGDIVSTDTIIITTFTNGVSLISDEIDGFVTSMKELPLYFTPVSESRTETLMIILNRINDSIDHIRHIVRQVYVQLFNYITVRTSYWKKQLYGAKSVQEMANDAFSRWKKVTKEIDY